MLGKASDGAATIAELESAAGVLGFAVAGVEATWPALASLPLPAVARVRNPDGRGHFVVVQDVDPEGAHVTLSDPARGVVSMPHDEFRAKWTGEVLVTESMRAHRRLS